MWLGLDNTVLRTLKGRACVVVRVCLRVCVCQSACTHTSELELEMLVVQFPGSGACIRMLAGECACLP